MKAIKQFFSLYHPAKVPFVIIAALLIIPIGVISYLLRLVHDFLEDILSICTEFIVEWGRKKK